MDTQDPELKVFISHRDSTCGECGERLGHSAWITLAGEKGAACLACADLAHLVFLPAGDTALTRRARAHSRLSAVALKLARARKRYERQGLLVEEEALRRAEEECLADAEVRERRRERGAERRAREDPVHVERFAQSIRRFFPGCPPGREHEIARHACERSSGRVGRAAFAREPDGAAAEMAVAASVRHRETDYDELMMSGLDRLEARERVRHEVSRVLDAWRRGQGA